MKRRIFPDHVTLDSYVVPHGVADGGATRYVVSIGDDHHSKELFYTLDITAAVRFANRSAGQRGLPVVNMTVKGAK